MAEETDDRLRLLIERVERLEEEKGGITADIKDVYLEAKAVGYDARVMRQIVRLRKMRPDDRQEMEAILDLYKCALGLGGEYARKPADQAAEPTPLELAIAHAGSSDEKPTAPSAPDDLYDRAVRIVSETGKPSASFLQRNLRTGYNTASRLIERMETAGLISAPDHLGRRTVLSAA